MKAITSHQHLRRIQQQLNSVDGDIQGNKRAVHYWKGEANWYGEELKRLESTIKEEGLFCVYHCVGCQIMAMHLISYDTSLLCISIRYLHTVILATLC